MISRLFFRRSCIRYGVLFYLLLIAKMAYPVNLNGVDVPRDKLILYLFIGQSNMLGYGGIMDTVTHPRAWMYNTDKGFWNARDPVENTFNAPSPVMPFLKKMAEYYPDYYFCGIKVTQPAFAMCDHFLRGKDKYTAIMKMVNTVKDSVTFGGILGMFGLVEGISDTLSQNLDQDIFTMLTQLREDCGVAKLPFIIGRYEEFADTTKLPQYYKYRQRIISKLEMLQTQDAPYHRVMMTPFLAVPKAFYFDDHHYNEKGYEMWSHTAAEILYKSNWNLWYANKIKPLQILFPRGGETFTNNSRIPLSWMCDLDSLVGVFIQASMDGGKTWTIISGDKNLPPEIKTFYWTPKPGRVMPETDSLNVIVMVKDYGPQQYFCTSEIFMIDTNSVALKNNSPDKKRPVGMLYTNGSHLFLKIQPAVSQREASIYTLRGQSVYHCTVPGNLRVLQIPLFHFSNEVFVFRLRSPGTNAPECSHVFMVIK